MELFLEDLLKSADGTASLSQPKATRTSTTEIFTSDKSQNDLSMTDTATEYSSSHFIITICSAIE
uniref:Uncharacterized protein n=1 Tax=Pristionchus pacificus TaxID=54126 RepID=A0A2A6D1X3_PRIPA|eukprot:PDM84380.1 hypothetical protein PRIPAC_33403 [Pristionchus pacificus]